MGCKWFHIYLTRLFGPESLRTIWGGKLGESGTNLCYTVQFYRNVPFSHQGASGPIHKLSLVRYISNIQDQIGLVGKCDLWHIYHTRLLGSRLYLATVPTQFIPTTFPPSSWDIIELKCDCRTLSHASPFIYSNLLVKTMHCNALNCTFVLESNICTQKIMHLEAGT